MQFIECSEPRGKPRSMSSSTIDSFVFPAPPDFISYRSNFPIPCIDYIFIVHPFALKFYLLYMHLFATIRSLRQQLLYYKKYI